MIRNISKITITFLLTSFLFASCSIFRADVRKSAKDYSLSIEEIVRTLSSDEFEGRYPGTPGMKKAAAFVEDYLIKTGVAPYFNCYYKDTVQYKGRESYNIVGLIEARKKTNNYVIIGAHLDHIGKKIYFKDYENSEDTVYNGANDNASGVTAVLKIAEKLKQHNFDKNIIIALFTEEERGLIGSTNLAERLKRDSINLSYMINIEMLGKPLLSDSSKIFITGYEMSNFSSKANELMGYEFIKYEDVDKMYGLFSRSDNYPFYLEFNVPSHTICSFDFKNFIYYHDTRDEFSELDINYMNYIIDETGKMIVKLLKSNVEIKNTLF